MPTILINDPKAEVSKARAGAKAGLETQIGQAITLPTLAGLLCTWFGRYLPDGMTPDMLVGTLAVLFAALMLVAVPIVRWWNRKRVYDAPPNTPTVQVVQST